jgi:hypothetical protein
VQVARVFQFVRHGLAVDLDATTAALTAHRRAERARVLHAAGAVLDALADTCTVRPASSC